MSPLAHVEEIPSELVDRLSDLPGFRNVLVHDYVELDEANPPDG